MKKLMMIVCFLFGMTLFTSPVHAREINDHVTEFQVSKSEINAGEMFNATVNFDDARGKIHAGDTITVAWQSDGDAYFEGFAKNLPFIVKGYNVGQVVITTSGAQATFNQNVEKLDDVSGSFHFALQGQKRTDGSRASDLHCGSYTKRVTIKRKASGGGDYDFYYKTGAIYPGDSEHVTWFLEINADKKNYLQSPTLEIKDTINPQGQELVEDSIVFYSEDQYGKSEYLNKDAFVERGNRLEIKDNQLLISVKSDLVNYKRLQIKYQTKITNEKQACFANNSQATYTLWGEKETSKESDYTVKNISASADITGTIKGELKIHKVIKGTDVPIEGVKFLLKGATEGQIVKDGKTELELTTDHEGIADVKGLPVGQYKVWEVGAPNWVDLKPMDSQEPLLFEMKETDTQGKYLHIENTILQRNIVVEKKWIGKTGDHATIHLMKTIGNDTSKVDQYRLSAKDQWSHTFKNLPVYDASKNRAITYFIKEDQIDGYASKIKDFKVINTYQPSLSLTKHVSGEAGDHQKLFHFTITLENDQGKALDGTYDGVTFTNGKSTIALKDQETKTISHLPYGAHYHVEETDGEGYVISYEHQQGILKEDVDVKITNHRDLVPATGSRKTSTKGFATFGLLLGSGLLLPLFRRKRHGSNNQK